MGLFARLRSLLRGLFRRSHVESEIAEEFRHHIELRTADLMREGLSRREAARQAHLEFGHEETHREAARASRGLRFFDRIRFSWIDVKLGLRMLWKRPGLTLVAVFALGIGIPVGLAPMHLANALEAGLPEDPGNRVRAIRFWDPVTTGVAAATYGDYEMLRGELETFGLVGAFRQSAYNIGSEDGRAAPVVGVEVTASVFEILGTPPLMGRYLTVDDEAPGAGNVIVLGHDVWEARFGRDPDIVGRTVRVSQAPYTVVGVMPSGFFFPVRQQAWLPLRRDPAAVAGEGLGLLVFGRLASGVGPEEAQSELDAVGLRARVDLPASRVRLQPEVVPFSFQFIGVPRSGLDAMPEFYIFVVLALAVLLIACSNVAMLVFARTATRFRELAVRTALGASRVRIVSQMFAETLVLSVLAAGAGLFTIDWVLRHVRGAAVVGEATLPYFLSLRVTPRAALWALGLAVASAVVAGVVPALRITGTRVQESIRRAEAGSSGIRFGGVTGAMVIADVAVSIAAIAFAIGVSDRMLAAATNADLTGIPAQEFLAATLTLPLTDASTGASVDVADLRERLGADQQTLVERLRADPGVRSVAVADALPRMDSPAVIVELEGVELPGPNGGIYVRTATVDVDFFAALDAPILSGRGFDRLDLSTDAPPVIVNTVFADRFLGGRDPVGRRVRVMTRAGAPAGPWRQIVGMVGHLGENVADPGGTHAMYVPAPPGSIYPLRLGIHVRESPEAFAPRLRRLLQEVDPDLVLAPPVVLGDVYPGDWYIMMLATGGFALLVLILVTLAASGIYAMMSFSVSERTREIGIRTALGARRLSLVVTILRRSLTQIGIGALIGAPLASMIFGEFHGVDEGDGSAMISTGVGLALASAIVAAVALSSCVAPARRALRIEASEALRSE